MTVKFRYRVDTSPGNYLIMDETNNYVVQEIPISGSLLQFNDVQSICGLMNSAYRRGVNDTRALINKALSELED